MSNNTTTAETVQNAAATADSAEAIKDAAAKQAKQAKPEVTKESKDLAEARELVQTVHEMVRQIANTINASKAGPLAVKQAAADFGASVERSGAPGIEAWQALGLLAAAVQPGMRLRQECADIARSMAKRKLAPAIADDVKLRRALDKTARITGKGSQHDAGGALSIKFGVPSKIEAVF